MSGNPKALRDLIGAMNNGGKVALLGILADEAAIDWNQVIFKGLTLEGHLWPRDVRDLVQDAGDAAERARRDAGHHASPANERISRAGFAALNAGRACKVVLDFNA